MSNGGYKGASPARETSPEQYPGVWELTEQFQAQADGNWPFQANDCAPKSLRFDGSSAYLSRTLTASGNRRVWTMSMWVKRSKLGVFQDLFGAGQEVTNDGKYARFSFMADDTFRLRFWTEGLSLDANLQTTRVFRDCSAFYHFVIRHDSTETNQEDRLRIYVNGELITSYSSPDYLSQNVEGHWNFANKTQVIGAHYDGGGSNTDSYFDGYISEVHHIDGQSLPPEEFAFFDGQGIWQPKRFTGDYSSGPVYSNFINNQATGNIISTPSTKGPQVMFDGQLNTLTNISSGYVEIDLSSFGLVADSNGVEIYNTEAGAYTSYQINGGTAVNWGGTAGWQSFGGAGAVNTIRMNYLSGGNVNVAAAIRINGQILTDASVGRNSFHLDFNDNSSAAALGTDTSGAGNDWDVYNLSGQPTLSSYNLDVTSTPFEDIGTSVSISNPAVSGQTVVSTTTATTNSFNLTTVADVGSANFLRSAALTIPPIYTIDYYYRASGTQVSNARAIRAHNGSVAVIDDYGSQTSRTIRLNNQSSGNVDKAYSITDGAWNHVRITRNGVWVNGTSVQSSPPNIGGMTVNYVSHGGLDQSTSYQLAGEIGPVRIAPVDLGAPASGGLVANSDGTLTTLSGSNPNTDSLVDTPTNGSQTDTGVGGEVVGNYATLNPLFIGNGQGTTLSNGNLDYLSTASSGQYATRFNTIGVSSDKWYFEFTINAIGNGLFLGISSDPGAVNNYIGQNTTSWGYLTNGTKWTNGGSSSYGASYTSGDVIGVALDLDAGTISFYKNGASQGTAYSSLPTGTYFIGISGTTNVSVSCNFGQRPFAHPVSGYKALCTANLDDPVVAQPSTVMDVKLYTGNGSTQTISGLGFEPDLVWIKKRNSATFGSHQFVDQVRGYDKYLFSDATNSETTATDRLTAFLSDGFSLSTASQVNGLSDTYVAWTWDAGTTTASNPDGSITSSVRANASAGFSIVSYTGPGSSATIGHGLNAVPEFIIVKNRDYTDPWAIYHVVTGANKLVYLDTSVPSSVSGYWGSGPTSSVFGIGNYGGVARSSDEFIAYCFAPVDGYSSFGSYTGNGSADGPFVFTGMRPKFLLVKNTDAGNNWCIIDSVRNTYNIIGQRLFPNLSNAEDTQLAVDFLSNGFKIRNAGSSVFNNSGQVYIYAAFAESPQKYSRAR